MDRTKRDIAIELMRTNEGIEPIIASGLKIVRFTSSPSPGLISEMPVTLIFHC